jgi:PII-like signaling protein
MHLAGASVFLVDLSYGAHRQLRDAKSEYRFVDIPIVVEVVDAADRVEELLDRLRPMMAEGFATVEPVRVVRYAHHENRPEAGIMEPASQAGRTLTSAPDDRESVVEEPMPIDGEAQRVTVYIGNSDTWHGRNLAMAIIERCRKTGIAGATASLGVMGFGKHSRLHRAHLLGLSEDLPERIEIVDRPDRIAQILPDLVAMVGGGLIIVEDVRAVHYRHHREAPAP